MEQNLNIAIQQMNKFGKDNTPFFFVIDFEMKTPKVFSINELNEKNIFVHFPNFSNFESLEVELPSISLIKNPISFSIFKKGFDLVQKNIFYGNSFLTNYTCATPIKISAKLIDIFKATKAKYKVFFYDEWLCFSPETFVQITDNTIKAFPMKGTIDASLPNAKNVILNDEKEKAEHFTIVDLLRNDLSIVAKNVVVENFRYVEEIKTSSKNLLQVSSCISGKLSENYNENIGEIICKLLPAGSISGAPKKKTIEIINEAEPNKRGFYTGIAAYFDGKNLDSCVLIRFIEKTKNGFEYKSGGGITCNSIAENEYQEMIDKIYLPLNLQ